MEHSTGLALADSDMRGSWQHCRSAQVPMLKYCFVADFHAAFVRQCTHLDYRLDQLLAERLLKVGTTAKQQGAMLSLLEDLLTPTPAEHDATPEMLLKAAPEEQNTTSMAALGTTDDAAATSAAAAGVSAKDASQGKSAKQSGTEQTTPPPADVSDAESNSSQDLSDAGSKSDRELEVFLSSAPLSELRRQLLCKTCAAVPFLMNVAAGLLIPKAMEWTLETQDSARLKQTQTALGASAPSSQSAGGQTDKQIDTSAPRDSATPAQTQSASVTSAPASEDGGEESDQQREVKLAIDSDAMHALLGLLMQVAATSSNGMEYLFVLLEDIKIRITEFLACPQVIHQCIADLLGLLTNKGTSC